MPQGVYMTERKKHWRGSQRIKILVLAVLLSMYYVTYHFEPFNLLFEKKN